MTYEGLQRPDFAQAAHARDLSAINQNFVISFKNNIKLFLFFVPYLDVINYINSVSMA